MKMRPEFEHIRKYNASKLNCIIERSYCNTKIEANLKELEYYKIARPIEGLDNHAQVIIIQVILNKMVELYEELERLKIQTSGLATCQSLAQFLGDLYTYQY